MSSASFQDLAKQGLLRPWLRSQVIVAATRHVEISEEERTEIIQRFAQEQHIKSEDELKRAAEQQALSLNDFIENIQRPAKIAKYCHQHFSAKAEARFLERKLQLDQVVYSLLRLQNHGLARELYLQITAEEASFADLAALHSQGPEQKTRGIVGPVPLSQGHPLLVDRLRTAKPGVVLEPFQIQEWWLVMRLEQLMPATFNQQTADAMSSELFEQWVNEQVERQLAELRPVLLGH